MGATIKMSDNVFWDPSAVTHRVFTSTDPTATSAATWTSTSDLQNRFVWLDCGSVGSTSGDDDRKISGGKYKDFVVTFHRPFNDIPAVVCFLQTTSGHYQRFWPVNNATARSITKTGFVARINLSATDSTETRSPGFRWIAAGS